jgi:hypothetical protein
MVRAATRSLALAERNEMGIVETARLSLLSDKEYYGAYGQYMSVSLLKKFAEDPLGFDDYMLNRKENEKPTDALVMGQATHLAIMEGWDDFDREYVVTDELVNPRSGKTYGRGSQKFQDTCEKLGVNPWRALSTYDVESIKQMDNAIRGDLEASAAISGCTKIEWAIRGKLHGVPFQGKLDGCDDNGNIVDLKTMRPDSTVIEQIYNYRYTWQAYSYNVLYAAATGMDPKDVTFTFVFVTKEESPRVSVVTYGFKDLVDAGFRVGSALNAYRISGKDRRLALFELEE